MIKTALVTGSAGFIGRHVVEELRQRGMLCMEVDIDYGGLGIFQLSAYRRFDLVVHCAAVSPHRAGIDSDHSSFIKNVQLDSSLFEWAIRTGQERVLYFSSSAVYPALLQAATPCDLSNCNDCGPRKLSERDTIDFDPDPFDNYGWAKLTGERMADAARKAGLPVTVVRPFSGYGEDQTIDFPFPAIVSRVAQGDLSVWGPPGQCRDWIHVEDVVAGSLAVVESGTEEPVNLCTGVGTEMGDLAKMIAGKPDAEIEYQVENPTGVFYRVGDPTRMQKYYTPKISLEEGIRRALKVR